MHLQDAEAARLFADNERLIQEHVRKYKNGAAELKDSVPVYSVPHWPPMSSSWLLKLKIPGSSEGFG